jgi:hypothetical protein
MSIKVLIIHVQFKHRPISQLVETKYQSNNGEFLVLSLYTKKNHSAIQQTVDLKSHLASVKRDSGDPIMIIGPYSKHATDLRNTWTKNSQGVISRIRYGMKIASMTTPQRIAIHDDYRLSM